MSKKEQICVNEDCPYGIKKCLRAHSPLDWYPTHDLYIKYPGKWDDKHREKVALQEKLFFHTSLKDAKDSLSYYYIAKFNEDVERHLQFFLTLKKIAIQDDECKAAECSSPFVDPIEAELEQARIEYEEKVKHIKEKPTRQVELLQEQEVLKQEMREILARVANFHERWSKWFPADDARLTI